MQQCYIKVDQRCRYSSILQHIAPIVFLLTPHCFPEAFEEPDEGWGGRKLFLDQISATLQAFKVTLKYCMLRNYI